MKPYGLPRNDDILHPDLADIRHYALKSSTGRLIQHGSFRSYFKKSRVKRATRRYWKRKERLHGRILSRLI